MELFSREGYEFEKERTLRELRHALEQGEKDQWFNAIRAMGSAATSGAAALQSIVNRGSWR